LKHEHIKQDVLLLGAVLVFLFSVLWSGANSGYAFANRPGHVYDNYYIVRTARNITIGKGWGLWSGEEFVHFDHEISTGPTVFLPVALALKLIDDPDKARFIAVIFLNLLLTAVFFWKLRYFFAREVYTTAWVLMPFVLMGCMRTQWYLTLGEVSAILCVMLSGLYVAQKTISNKVILVSGFFSGLAIMSKLLAAISAAWVAIFLLVLMIVGHGWVYGFRKLTLWIAGFCIFPGIIALWHLIVFDGSIIRLFEYTLEYLGFYTGLGATATACEHYLECFKQYFQVAKSAWKFGQATHSPIFVIATLFVPVLGLGIIFKREKSMADYLFIALAGVCFMQLFYFFEVGGRRWPRYYFMGAVSALIFLCLFMAEYFHKWIKWPIVKGAIFLVLLAGAWYQSLPFYREQKVSSYRALSREVADYLNHQHSVSEVVWWGVGMQPFPVVSYYLDADKRWLSVKGFAENYLDIHQHGENLLVGADLYWKRPADHYFLFEQWQDIDLPEPFCATQAFRNELYIIFRCTPVEIEKLIFHASAGKFHFPK